VFTRPDGSRVEPNGRKCFRGNNSTVSNGELGLLARNRENGLAIHWRTARCRWGGERMDYALAVQALIQRRDMAAARQPD
jgi:hypothetical protein